jgi:hypothetical protein
VFIADPAEAWRHMNSLPNVDRKRFLDNVVRFCQDSPGELGFLENKSVGRAIELKLFYAELKALVGAKSNLRVPMASEVKSFLHQKSDPGWFGVARKERRCWESGRSALMG